MRTLRLRRLSQSVQRGYLVYSGQSLGVDLDDRMVVLDADVVVLEISESTPGWTVRFYPIDVRKQVGPAA